MLDKNAGMMDRFGESKLEDLRKKTTGILKPQPHICRT